jgi:FkbM family methyltransferase
VDDCANVLAFSDGIRHRSVSALEPSGELKLRIGNMLLRLWRGAAARLPRTLQFELRRARYSRQIRSGTFASPEREARDIARYLREGDWAVDVGANIGHYTCRMGHCVGVSGRILAFEPIPVSFALLTANVRVAGLRNVTLFNIALSSRAGLMRMTVPWYESSGLNNYYRAHVSAEGEYPVFCLPLDTIPIPSIVRLVKVDAEGHDLDVLIGMEALLRRCRPVLIVESRPESAVASWLMERGYAIAAAPDSSNIVATPQKS